jgi:hypothetical protein
MPAAGKPDEHTAGRYKVLQCFCGSGWGQMVNFGPVAGAYYSTDLGFIQQVLLI